MAQIDKFLELAIKQRASDLHLASGETPRARVDGDLIPISDITLRPEDVQALMFEMLSAEDRERLLKNKNLDKSYTLPGVGFFRVNMYYTRRGLSAVLRTIPTKIPTMEDLKLPESVKNLADAAKGLVLVTGPTGSGKSTTLASMIDYLNSNYNYHILTVEDPVEFVHPTKKSLVNQREIGSSCPSFADALKYALREDPDVILVGEMRDLETIGLAITAAETGHLVFGTLHTRGAGASVDRIIDSFPANQQGMIRAMLSESLVGVVSQALLKRQDQPGRVAAFEILVTNHAISNLIREGKTFQIPSAMQTAKKDGMVLMDQHILELVEKGIVSAVEATPYMENPSTLLGKGKAAPNSPISKNVTPSNAPMAAPPAGGKPPSAPPLRSAPSARPPTARGPMPAPQLVASESEAAISPQPADNSQVDLNSLTEDLGLEIYEEEVAQTTGTNISAIGSTLAADQSPADNLLDVSISGDDSTEDAAEPTIAYATPAKGGATVRPAAARPVSETVPGGLRAANAPPRPSAAPPPVAPATPPPQTNLAPKPAIPLPTVGPASKRPPPPPPPPINKKTG